MRGGPKAAARIIAKPQTMKSVGINGMFGKAIIAEVPSLFGGLGGVVGFEPMASPPVASYAAGRLPRSCGKLMILRSVCWVMLVM
jgi:hypothetical protein